MNVRRTDRFLIAPFNSGLRTDVKPFMIPDNAFSELKNAYIFRGRIKRRFGSELTGNGAVGSINQTLYSRCAINLGSTNGSGVLSGTVPGAIFKVGQQFSIGNEVFTVQTTGTPVTMLTTGRDESGTWTYGTGTYHTSGGSAGNFSFTGCKVSTAVYFYPSEPIMGLTQFETTPVNNQIAFAFDTQFIYYFNAGRWIWVGPGATPAALYFKGTDAQFFGTCNYQGVNPEDTVLFASNFNATFSGAPAVTDDAMYYYNGTTWTSFAPTVKTGTTIVSARIIIPFHRHLLMLDTVEQTSGSNKRYKNRCRFSWDGSPINSYAWLEPNQLNAGGASWVDASTQEGIISAEYIKDRLIVYFERSTWELAYTGNDIEPFVWLKLNTELGSESIYATVPFDKVILTLGANGIHACNGSNVERIDKDIPDYVFQFNNENSGPARSQGIRDFKTEMVYWTVPIKSKNSLSYFPNTVLTYNYKTGSWGENDDCFTTFGYFEQGIDKTWADMTIPWSEANVPWNSYFINSKERLIIAGNQQGYIVQLNPNLPTNARAMTIANLVHDPVTGSTTITCMNHTLQPGDFVKLYDTTGLVWDSDDTKIHQVAFVDINTFTLTDCLILSGTYIGGGTVSRVSRISIKSKEWNFYIDEGRNFIINKIDFYVTRASGVMTTDFLLNSSSQSFANEATVSDVAPGNYKINLGSNANVGMEALQERIWRSQYFQAEGNTVQLWLYVDDDDMLVDANAFSGLEIHAIMIHARPTSVVMEDMTNEL